MLWSYLISGMPTRSMLRNYDRSFKVWTHWKRRLSCFDDREPRQSKQRWTQSSGKVLAACGVGSLEPLLMINLNRDEGSTSVHTGRDSYIILVTFIYRWYSFTVFILVSGIRVHFDHRRIRKSLVSFSVLAYRNHSNVSVGLNIVHIMYGHSFDVVVEYKIIRFAQLFACSMLTLFLRPCSLVSM